ncbi:MAG: hypothetical protein ACUVRV_08685 [Cyanobacteriota bacterium]
MNRHSQQRDLGAHAGPECGDIWIPIAEEHCCHYCQWKQTHRRDQSQ